MYSSGGIHRLIYPALAALLLFSFYYYTYVNSRTEAKPLENCNSDTPGKSAVKLGSFDGTWNFERDANNLLLSDAQCDAAFPGLFKEVDRAMKHWKKKPITSKNLDDIKISNGYVRGMIYDQRLYIIAQEGTFFSREYATISAIQRAVLTAPEPLPNIEFTFLTDDIVRPQPQWAYSRKTGEEDLWLMPDFGYYSWPETKAGAYHEIQRKAIATEKLTPWKDKISKAVWRGAILGLPVRQALLNVTKGKSWADVRILNWEKHESWVRDKLSMDGHCKYKYVVHTEGTSNSGRLKYLQNCRSVVVAHKLEWVQHHHHLMVSKGPKQNYVEVRRDFGDLEKTIKDLKAKEGQAEAIADRGIKLFRERYLTPAAETCYWRKLIRGWSTVSFKPEPFNATDGSWRGVAVESFLLTRTMKWGKD